MSYAIREDGQGWRAVSGRDDVGADELYSEIQPEPIAPDKATQARTERVPLLATADIEICKAEDNGLATTAWRKYRQALRDITVQADFPDTIIWPAVPQ